MSTRRFARPEATALPSFPRFAVTDSSAPPTNRVLLLDLASAPEAERSLLGPTEMLALSLEVEEAGQEEEGLALIRNALADQRPYVLAFVALPLASAADILRRLWQADPRLQIVLFAGPSEARWPDWAAAAGHPDDLIVLKQPAGVGEVRQAVRALTTKWLLAREVETRVAELEETVRTRTLEAERAQQGFAEVFNASPLAQSILALDRFEVIAVNSAYEKTLGFTVKDLKTTTPESFGRGLDSTRWRGLMAKLAAKEPVDDHPFVYEPKPGLRRDMVCTARALTVLGRPCSIWVIRDVTDQLRLAEQLRQTQKMDAIGQLAAGVAHDFNNLLTAIQAFTEQAIALSTEAPIRELLQPVMGSTRRAAALTRQLLLFSHKQAVEVRAIELTELLRDFQAVLRRLLPATVELEWELPESLPAVMADTANFEQIILNLVINARDALPAKGGTVRIAAAVREFATAEETGHAEGRSGRFIRVQVADNGSGIPPEVLPRIFEPFFTTKPVGQGTGLGLATVYSVARQHQGWIDVQTEVGRGTTFSVYHPVAAPIEAVVETEARPSRMAHDLSQSGIRKVLIVDDDPDVQAVLRMVLASHKIRAVSAPDATKALKLWHEAEGQFDLLITDVVMPNGHTGIELARILRHFEPELRVIIMTGYSAELFKPDSLAMPGKTPSMLLKPFDLAGVAEVIAAA